ncbi:NAD(P)-binding domain-containing protein [Kribbella sp. NBC_00382]|uniref:NADPH-dependent F420 reductase n=1 Tax=Kribbella sp. NBC_00382 TaxID=2975967 RepID=UPI002E240016
MKIAFLGTGNLAVALGKVWAAAGHEIFVAGRSSDNSAKAAAAFSGTPIEPAGLAAVADVIVVAVAWEGLPSMLSLAGAPDGAFAGKTVIDCTNAVDYATGRLKPESGSAAALVASLAPGAHVVKALHLFAGTSWPGRNGGAADAGVERAVVAVCGDDGGALEVAATLIGDLGGETAVVGDLSSARQLEEAAGFVMRVVAAGYNPRSAVPDVRVG